MASSLTLHLRETLAQSRAALDDWVERERHAADAQASAAAQQLRDKQRAIDAASAQLLALQLQSGCDLNSSSGDNCTAAANLANASLKRKELEQRVQNQKVANARFEAQLEEMKKKLEDLLPEYKLQKARALAAKEQAATVAASKETTVSDLTRGILNYKFLGLDFEKADNERLRFSFTQLDPANPNQKYSFCLEATDDGERLSVVEIEPPGMLSDETVDELVAPLNRTNDTGDMMFLVRGMRRAFLQRIVITTEETSS